MQPDSLICVFGCRGLVGRALVRHLQAAGYGNLLLPDRSLDLLNQEATFQYLLQHKPDYVFLAAARVGGIIGNSTFPADFLYENLQIQNNVIMGSWQAGVKKLLFLGSSCIYPKHAEQPMQEQDLLTGPLEPTNEAYAIAKIAGLKLCQAFAKQHGANFISCMPTNLYGIHDNFHPEHGHVIPGLIHKFYQAKLKQDSKVVCFGTGTPLREFLYVDDMAEACILLMQKYTDTQNTINIGSGHEIRIKDLVHTIADLVDYRGEIVWDTTKPDGTPRKLVDSSKIRNLGWEPKVPLHAGLERTVNWFFTSGENVRTGS